MDSTQPGEMDPAEAGTRGKAPLAPRTPWASAEGRSLVDWLRVLRDGWPAVILLTLLGIGAGVGTTLRQPTQYESKATLVASSSSGFLNPEFAGGFAQVAATVTRLAGSAAVLRGASVQYLASALDPATHARRQRQTSLDWMSSHLQAQQVADSGIVELSGQADTQADARDLTNAGASSLERTIAAATAATLPKPAPRTRRTNTAPSTVVPTSAAIRSFQTRDNGKVSPTPTRNVLLGGNVGLALGIVAGLALGATRRRVRRPDEMASELGVPVLGSVRAGHLGPGINPVLSAARARLQRLGQRDKGTVFLLTGTVRPEWTAELGEGLARAFAASSRTVLVDADLSSQCASRRLNLEGVPGLGELLDGHRPGHPELFRPEQVMVTTVNGDGDSEIEVLPAGETPPDVSAALSGNALVRSLQNLRLRYDFILVVGPGLDRPAEVIPLISAADWSVLVTPQGERARTIESAHGLTDALAGRVAGALIVNRR
jgi:capsular polysaccharide biosynthesis protein